MPLNTDAQDVVVRPPGPGGRGSDAPDARGSGGHEADLELAQRILEAEARAVAKQVERLGPAFVRAVSIVEETAEAHGTVLVAGLGKSGLIGRKISATLASLGVPSHDIHPTEALHGDLGRINRGDCLIALSNSGETEEVVTLALICKQDAVPVISITGGEGQSALARLADAPLTMGTITEASDLSMAPTCSTTAMLALGDALALTVAQRRRFSHEDFAKRHPGGTLGGLLRPVMDAVRFSAERGLPVAHQRTPINEALRAAERVVRRPGALLIVDDAGALVGILTDADIRRLVIDHPERLDRPLEGVMTPGPRCLPHSALLRDAARMVREHRQDEIPIVDEQGRPVGLLDVQDLIAMRIVREASS
ncbi:MAG: KpsF/GutQ family sugar-phosphate isomerase [Phycisphaerales bacterium]